MTDAIRTACMCNTSGNGGLCLCPASTAATFSIKSEMKQEYHDKQRRRENVYPTVNGMCTRCAREQIGLSLRRNEFSSKSQPSRAPPVLEDRGNLYSLGKSGNWRLRSMHLPCCRVHFFAAAPPAGGTDAPDKNALSSPSYRALVRAGLR